MPRMYLDGVKLGHPRRLVHLLQNLVPPYPLLAPAGTRLIAQLEEQVPHFIYRRLTVLACLLMRMYIS